MVKKRKNIAHSKHKRKGLNKSNFPNTTTNIYFLYIKITLD